MIDWSQFHFLRPAWFALLLPLALLLWQLARRRRASRGWEAVCDPALLPHVLVGENAPAGARALWAVALAGILATLALAGPAWSRLPQPVFSSTRALVIALDLSLSMGATDVAPSRLERARYKISDLLRVRRDGQTALLVYAGDAFTVSPLTDDAATLLSQLPALAPTIMPVPGSNIAAALGQSRALLSQAGLDRGDVLIITDEIDDSDGADLARALRSDGYRISVLGVGTEQGAPIPMIDGSFLEDGRGQIVIPALKEAPLRQFATAGGGIYRRIAVDDSDVGAIMALLDGQVAADEARATELRSDVWRDQGPWLVLALLPLAALGFRRGLVLALALTVFPWPPAAQALEWNDLWLRADQQGKRALDAGDAGRAAGLFADPRWRGAARYQAGDYPGTLESLQKLDDVESLYNRGNALARMGRYPDAVAAYDAALKLQPDHADARYNRDLVQRQMQAPESPQHPGRSGEPDAADGSAGDPAQDAEQQPTGEPAGSPPQAGTGVNQETSPQAAEESSGNPPPAAEDAGTPRQESDPATAQADAQQEDAAPESAADALNATAPETQPAQDGAEEPVPAAAPAEPVDEDRQAVEQWLRRIPDDPGGLLRRKFLYQYQVRRGAAGAGEPGEKTW